MVSGIQRASWNIFSVDKGGLLYQVCDHSSGDWADLLPRTICIGCAEMAEAVVTGGWGSCSCTRVLS